MHIFYTQKISRVYFTFTNRNIWLLYSIFLLGEVSALSFRTSDSPAPRIQQQIDIDDMHFGFMKGKGITDDIFIVKQMQEKFRAKGKKL